MEKDELSLEELDQIRAGNFSSAVGESMFNNAIKNTAKEKADLLWNELVSNVSNEEEMELVLEELNNKAAETQKTTGMSR